MPKTVSRAEPLVAVNAVSHLAIEVCDLARSISFYETVLGLDVFQDNRDEAHQPNIKGLIGGWGWSWFKQKSPQTDARTRQRPANLRAALPVLFDS